MSSVSTKRNPSLCGPSDFIETLTPTGFWTFGRLPGPLVLFASADCQTVSDLYPAFWLLKYSFLLLLLPTDSASGSHSRIVTHWYLIHFKAAEFAQSSESNVVNSKNLKCIAFHPFSAVILDTDIPPSTCPQITLNVFQLFCHLILHLSAYLYLITPSAPHYINFTCPIILVIFLIVYCRIVSTCLFLVTWTQLVFGLLAVCLVPSGLVYLRWLPTCCWPIYFAFWLLKPAFVLLLLLLSADIASGSQFRYVTVII